MINFLARLVVFVRGLYTTPEDHRDPYLWALVAMGHRSLGEVASAGVWELTHSLNLSVLIPAAIYAFLWELPQVRAGGKRGDGMVDICAFWCGCLSAGGSMAGMPLVYWLAVGAFLALLFRGMDRRLP